MFRSWFIVLVGALTVVGAGQAQEVSAVPAMVHWDWYYRESLRAIDDWERLLEQREAEVGREQSMPVFPVPSDGTSVVWPNAIPRLLLPPRDRQREYRLELREDQIAVVRTPGDGRESATVQVVPADKPVRMYQHPGGGGRDQWYHAYTRRFDQLTSVVPRPAPFAVELPSLHHSQFGRNELTIGLRNVTREPQSLTCEPQLYCLSPEAGRAGDGQAAPSARKLVQSSLGTQVVELPPQEARAVRCSWDLTAPGGGLVVICLRVQQESYWIPLLTHVEDVAAVLAGVDRILSDTPDDAAARQLAAMRGVAEATLRDVATPRPPDWQTQFVRACQLRDELLLRRLEFSRLLFLQRKPFYSEQPFMDAHHCYNRPGGAVCSLEPVRPDGKVTAVVGSLGRGVYRDLTLNWDAEQFVFAFGNGSDRVARTTGDALQVPDGKADYDLYEARVDGGGVRQLTATPKNDCEPFYLPDGRIGFTSDRSEHYVMCGSDIHVANLFTMHADGSDVRQLSSNVFNDFNPSMLPDGRIIYNRWEYNERSVTSLHNLFTMHPDGSHVAPYYGNATFRPNVIMFPRAVPGSSQVMALFTGHHGQTHGPIALIDVRRGVDGDGPLTLLTPNVPVIAEKIEDSRGGWFSDPQPLSETTFLCSYTPTVLPWLEESWAIYVGDRHGNLALVYRDAEISCAEPVPVVRRPRPPVLPTTVDRTEEEEPSATLLLVDVYEGLPGVPRGTAKYLRVLEDVPRKGVATGGVICTSGTQIYTIKRILGTVPVAPDGSAHFLVPANRNVYFEVLDDQQLEIQRMRSVVCLQPGEQRTCMGCHESRTSAPLTRQTLAAARPPVTPDLPPWGTAILSYLRDVQPVLNDKCASCHAFDRTANGVILTDDLTDQFVVGYEELLPYLSVANAMRWDHPDDVYARPPYTYGSSASPLSRLLRAGHHDVRLDAEQWQRLGTWIDANAVYYDRYESDPNNRRIFIGQLRAELESVFAKRCALCHGENDDGRHGTWWMSVNRHDPAQSRALLAPLARAAGGWQRCDQVVFADTKDPDFQRLLAALTRLREELAAQPRADLLSIQGTPAEQQPLRLPEPPTPQPMASEEVGAAGQWVSVCDLPWPTAIAGWTRNQDGQPRRNKDVEDQPLRVGPRRYGRGIGTHAPSEVACVLDGQYRRFAATVAGAEANGTVSFQVFGDDQLLFDSGLMRGLREVKKVDVDVSGVRQLRLVVTDAGDGYIHDMANWADARLEKCAQANSRDR